MPVNICIECGAPYYWMRKREKGTCSREHARERINRMARGYYRKKERARREAAKNNP